MGGKRHPAVLIALAIATPAPAAAPARFDPLAFFAGRTEGTGRLKIVLRRGRGVRVEGRGRVEQGTLVLDQRVAEEGKPPRTRTWRIRAVAPGRYAGTLSDAAGPVAGETSGDRLHLSFPMTGGLRAEQWLQLEPGGRAARNRLVVRKLGITVARLDERIVRID
jgi:hypothetical protein